MNVSTESVKAQIEAFRRFITPDFYSPESFIPWDEIELQLYRLSPGIDQLQALADSNDLSAYKLFNALGEQQLILDVIRKLLSSPQTSGFLDGRQLPIRVPLEVQKRKQVAELIIDLGIERLLRGTSKVGDLLRVALVAGESDRRRFGIQTDLKDRVKGIIGTATEQAAAETGLSLTIVAEVLRYTTLRRLDYVIEAEGKALAAIETIFSMLWGGRQQRELTLTLPTMQKELDRIPAELILITDGRGLQSAPDHVLVSLFDSLAACMTLQQAEDGMLRDALIQAVRNRGQRLTSGGSLGQIIQSTLSTGSVVPAEMLPGSPDEARLALATYQREHPSLALTLSSLGQSLFWTRANLVERALKLVAHFNSSEALRIFSDLLNATQYASVPSNTEGLNAAIVKMDIDPILPSTFLVICYDGVPNPEVFREVARTAHRLVPNAKVAALLVPNPPVWKGFADRDSLQSTLTANVIAVSSSDLLGLAQGSETPRNGFVTALLQQSDLTKVSPYVLNSATPERMFFGRESEEATMVVTLATNSVALLGGRRIGKTSLMHHVRSGLEESDFRPFFMDCQTVRNWRDFGNMAARLWSVQLPEQFKPQHLFQLIEQLDDKSGKRIVFLLDEIDQLLDWDQQHTVDEVAEAFFRACRTMSQEGTAQFVFSGERIIAGKLWNPQSPHWNFCRPLALQQLSRVAGEQLLLRPLEALQISIVDQERFADRGWHLTSGHPQIEQFLGDRLVRSINQRPPSSRSTLSLEDLEIIAGSWEYREHYLTTYWGQATPFERIISLFVAGGYSSLSDLMEVLEEDLKATEQVLMDALRMLELYGILRRHGLGYALRAEWFPAALISYGGIESSIDRLVTDRDTKTLSSVLPDTANKH